MVFVFAVLAELQVGIVTLTVVECEVEADEPVRFDVALVDGEVGVGAK